MRRFRNLLPIALGVLALGSSACIYEREVVRDEPVVEAPPPPPAADQPPGYQAEAPPPPAGSEIADDEVFYGTLSPYGSWTFVAPYGRVWIPAVGYGWRPYYYGRWVLTDWGWTFVSDDPWGWAAYHYGRWNWGIGVGWYWIPGHIWGPAWVSWRWGFGYAAWCPLGPPGVFFGYHHPAWVAVPEQHFTRPIRSVAIPGQATVNVVARAQPLTGPRASPTSRSFGPPVAGVQKAVGQPIARVPVSQVIARPHATAGAAPHSAAAGPMRSPMQPKPRAGSGGDARATPGAVAPRPTPRPYGGTPGRSGGVVPRSGGGHGGAVAPRPRGGGEGGGRGAVQGAPHGGGGGGAPAPSAPAPKGGGSQGGGPHAGPKSK